MKHKLLSIFTLVSAMFMSASVWAYDAPEEVIPSYTTDWTAPENGGVYFLYNVGADQYLGAGNNWGTHVVTATVGEKSEAEVFYWNVNITLSASSDQTNYCCGILPIILTQNEDGTFYIEHMGSDRSDCYLTSEDGNSWIDGGLGRASKFKIVAVEGGYTIQAINTEEAGTYFGAKDPDEEPEGGETVVRNVMNNLTTADNIIWRFAPTNYAQYQAYQTRLSFYELLKEAEDLSVDNTAAIAVYEDPGASEEQLLDAYYALKAEVYRAKFIAEGATDEEPLEVTDYCLVNPAFEDGNTNGWTCTFVGGVNATNVGYRGDHHTNKGSTLTPAGSKLDDDGNPSYIKNFIEAWKDKTDPFVIGDAELTQTVYGLPSGVYKLTCDVNAAHQWGKYPNPVSGVKLFIAPNIGKEVYQEVATIEANPEHFSITFTCPDGVRSLTFGLKTESTTANWIAADNFRIYYYGVTTMTEAQLKLKDMINTVTPVQEEENYYYSYSVTRETFEQKLKAANDLLKGEKQEEGVYEAATEELRIAYNALTVSMDVYKTLQPYTDYAEDVSKLKVYEEIVGNNEGWDDLEGMLRELEDDFYNAYTNGLWTDEEVKAQIAGILPMIRTWITEHPKALHVGNDVTFLLINADFSEGSYGRTDAAEFDGDENSIPGWTISSGNITELRHQTGNIETFRKKFDFHQTIPNMPAGVYDITVQGFVRHDDPKDTESTIFYAGDSKEKLMNCSDQNSTDGIWRAGDSKPEMGDNNRDIENTVLGGWQCSGMTGFYYWSQEYAEHGGNYLKYQEGDLYYTNHIKVTLTEAGDFTIGMKSLGDMDWIIWDNFKIRYIGEDPNTLVEMAGEKFEKLTNLLSTTEYPTAKAQTDYEAISKIDYTSITDLQEYNAYAEPVEALIAYIQEGTILGSTLDELVADYKFRAGFVSFGESFKNGKLQEYETALTQKKFPDNDYLREAPEILAALWTKSVKNAMVSGKFNNLNGFINNPKYTTATGYSLNGWMMAKADGVKFGNYLANMGVAEVFSPSGEYKHYQTLKSLDEGYYRVTVDAYFRPGDMKQEDGREACVSIPSRAFLFAEGGGETFVIPLKNILVGNDQLKNIGNETTWAWGAGWKEGSTSENEYTPDNVTAANYYFENVYNDKAVKTELVDEEKNQSIYRNAINVHVGADGILTIGITNHGVAETVTNDWACFSNWTLSYLGTEAPDAIKGISTKGATAPTAIFTIDGRQASRLQRGMNIVRQADGSVKKVLVK